MRRSLLRSNLKFNFVKLSFTFVFSQSNLKIQIRQLSLKFVCVANWVRNVGSNSSFFRTNSLFCHCQVLLGLYIWETNLIETLTKMNTNRRNCFCCLVLSYKKLWPTNLNCSWRKRVTKHEIEWQLFQNWSTPGKDEIETSIRTFQRVRDEIENTFSKIEWRENGQEILY